MVEEFNDSAKRASVRNLISSTGATIVCLQETKISIWTRQLLIDTVRLDMVENCVHLPATGVAGGILNDTSI